MRRPRFSKSLELAIQKATPQLYALEQDAEAARRDGDFAHAEALEACGDAARYLDALVSWYRARRASP